MSFLDTLILSIVEGITEFLPVSSTGHLVLASHILRLPQTEFLKSFEISIQLGAILSVVFLYWSRLVGNFRLCFAVLVAFLPSAFLGFLFYDYIKGVLIGNELVTIVALAVGGVVLMFFDQRSSGHPRSHSVSGGRSGKLELELGAKEAFLIGLAQSVSMVPGVSRAGATIVGGMLVGLNRKAAVEFSFLLAVPTMFAATGLDIVKTRFAFSSDELLFLAVGFVGAFMTATLAIKFFLGYVQKNSLFAFGVYRVVLAGLYWLFFLA